MNLQEDWILMLEGKQMDSMIIGKYLQGLMPLGSNLEECQGMVCLISTKDWEWTLIGEASREEILILTYPLTMEDLIIMFLIGGDTTQIMIRSKL